MEPRSIPGWTGFLTSLHKHFQLCSPGGKKSLCSGYGVLSQETCSPEGDPTSRTSVLWTVLDFLPLGIRLSSLPVTELLHSYLFRWGWGRIGSTFTQEDVSEQRCPLHILCPLWSFQEVERWASGVLPTRPNTRIDAVLNKGLKKFSQKRKMLFRA